jgi:membrane-associated phospholipid phosphatase
MVVPGMGTRGVGRPVVAARILSEVLAPAPVVTALLLVAAVATAPTPADAVRNALVAAVFGALVPLGFVLYQVRRRRFTDHHVSVRRQRPIVFVVAMASVLAGTGLLLWLGAPRALLGVIASGIIGIAVCGLLTTVWKVSVHAATVAGSVVLLAYLLGPLALVALAVVPVVGWARVAVGGHTPAEAAGGAIVGGVVAAVAYPLVTGLPR